ncbi:MAG TPA: hypothetical protein VNT79_05870 [Phycisphaerae bacterium]|nr:hypothetical protein [Phycisphaerae bacterium]
MIVEMLYVPLGRSGSADETYLIYEQPEEFMRALSLAQQLDATAGAGGRTPWSAGVGTLIEILGQGAVPDDALVARCESTFADAVQDSAQSGQQRWAAAVLAGKMAADYRYDYEKARAYFDSAIRQAKSESIEAMTAEWWRADTFMQEASARKANEAYEDILDGYTHVYPKSHVVEQSYAILKKNKKP